MIWIYNIIKRLVIEERLREWGHDKPKEHHRLPSLGSHQDWQIYSLQHSEARYSNHLCTVDSGCILTQRNWKVSLFQRNISRPYSFLKKKMFCNSREDYPKKWIKDELCRAMPEATWKREKKIYYCRHHLWGGRSGGGGALNKRQSCCHYTNAIHSTNCGPVWPLDRGGLASYGSQIIWRGWKFE